MLDKLATLHEQCFPQKPWSRDDFAELKKSGCEIVASENGFIVWRVAADEAELISIGVAPRARRGGIASAMIEIMSRDASARGATKIFLEVAVTNTAAIGLYERHGFTTVGRRPKYYDGVDALIMSLTL